MANENGMSAFKITIMPNSETGLYSYVVERFDLIDDYLTGITPHRMQGEGFISASCAFEEAEAAFGHLDLQRKVQ